MCLRENNWRDGNTFSLVLITFSRFPVYWLFDDVDSFYSLQTDIERAKSYRRVLRSISSCDFIHEECRRLGIIINANEVLISEVIVTDVGVYSICAYLFPLLTKLLRCGLRIRSRRVPRPQHQRNSSEPCAICRNLKFCWNSQRWPRWRQF